MFLSKISEDWRPAAISMGSCAHLGHSLFSRKHILVRKLKTCWPQNKSQKGLMLFHSKMLANAPLRKFAKAAKILRWRSPLYRLKNTWQKKNSRLWKAWQNSCDLNRPWNISTQIKLPSEIFTVLLRNKDLENNTSRHENPHFWSLLRVSFLQAASRPRSWRE